MSLLRLALPNLRPLSRAFGLDARSMLASLKKKQTSDFTEGNSKGMTKGEEGNKQLPGQRETPDEYLKHRQRMKERFPEGWNPSRKLSREAMDGLRVLHTHDPATFSTPVLAERFRISPEAVRRILKSKWVPKREERAKLLERDRTRKQEFIQQRLDRERADRQVVLEREQTEKQAKSVKRRLVSDRLTLR